MANKKRIWPSSCTRPPRSRSCGPLRCRKSWSSGPPSSGTGRRPCSIGTASAARRRSSRAHPPPRDGVRGPPRFFKAAERAGLRALVGAELTLEGGGCLPVLVESRRGYQNLCRLITDMKAGGPKGEGALRPAGLPDDGRTEGLVALPGVATLGHPPDTDRLAHVLRAFGAGNVALDVQRHRRRRQEAANQALLDLADALGLRAVASNGVRHARAPGRALQDVLTCIRE